MLREREVKEYFRKDGTVVEWWDPEKSDMSHIYARGMDIVSSWLTEPKGQKVLDVSCGRGRSLKRLSPDHVLTGLDISQEMLNQTAGLNLARTDLVQANAESMPFSINSHDSVVCLEALVHYPNPQNALNEFHRILKPDGSLIVDIDNDFSLKRVVKQVSHRINRLFDSDFEPASAGIFQAFDEADFKEMLEESGFQIEATVHLGVLVPVNFHLPNGGKIQLISEKMSRRLEPIDKIIEGLPVTSKLATYVLARCKKV